MKTGNLNGVDLLSTGGGTNYLADDGVYKALTTPTLQQVTDAGNFTTNSLVALSFNSVPLTAAGGGTLFLADDGTYKSTGGGGSQDLQSVLTQGNTSTLGATFGGDIKGDNFVGIGDTARNNALTKWGLQSRLFPYISEKLALFGDNVGGGGSFTTNAYYDGTGYKSLDSGICTLFTLTSGAGDYIIQSYTASAADEAITWSERYRIDINGNVTSQGETRSIENIVGDKFLGIGDTSRDDNLSGWSTQSRFFPIVSENMSFVGDNVSLGGFLISNAYYDGTNWRSIEAGNCQNITFSGGSGEFRIQYATSASANQIITWSTRMTLDSSGNVDFVGDVTANIPTGTVDKLVGADSNGKLVDAGGCKSNVAVTLAVATNTTVAVADANITANCTVTVCPTTFISGLVIRSVIPLAGQFLIHYDSTFAGSININYTYFK